MYTVFAMSAGFTQVVLLIGKSKCLQKKRIPFSLVTPTGAGQENGLTPRQFPYESLYFEIDRYFFNRCSLGQSPVHECSSHAVQGPSIHSLNGQLPKKISGG